MGVADERFQDLHRRIRALSERAWAEPSRHIRNLALELPLAVVAWVLVVVGSAGSAGPAGERLDLAGASGVILSLAAAVNARWLHVARRTAAMNPDR
jgi:hypothetical protein